MITLTITKTEQTEALTRLLAAKRDQYQWNAFCDFLFGLCQRERIDHNLIHCHLWARSIYGRPNCFGVAETAWRKHPTTD